MRTTGNFLLAQVFFCGALLSLFVIPCLAVATEEAAEATPLPVTQVLVSQEIPLHLPAFHEADRAGATWTDLLQEMPSVPGQQWPAAGREFAGHGSRAVKWQAVDAAGGHLPLSAGDGAGARYIAFYVTSDRWQKLELKVTGDHPVNGAVGGEALSFTKTGGEDGAPTVRTAELKLTIGKHLVVLRTLHHDELTAEWAFDLAVSPDNAEAVVALDVTPDHNVDIQTVLNAPRLGSVSLSPDGKLAAISLSEYRNGSDKESWLEVRSTRTGKLERLWRGDHAPSGVQWHPTGHQLAWQTNAGDKGTIRTFDFDSGEAGVALADVEHLGGWQWAPDGQSIIYAVTRKPKDDPRKVKRLLYPADRQP